jgi:hypothetical protein
VIRAADEAHGRTGGEELYDAGKSLLIALDPAQRIAIAQLIRGEEEHLVGILL